MAKLLLYLEQEEIGSGLILADLEQARWCQRMLFSLASKQQSASALAVEVKSMLNLESLAIETP